MLFFCAYIKGKLVNNINFDLRTHNKEGVKMVCLRAVLSNISKLLQYGAISFIPLTLSSCTSFTTGPIFSAILAWILIREKLNCVEVTVITCGIIGTSMLTMPQWYLFLSLDSEAIKERLANDLHENGYFLYYFGIIIALMSSALDAGTYFIIRSVPANFPKDLIPFASGGFCTIWLTIWSLWYEPFDFFSIDETTTP
jgi:drug/metabolite transporter (DMT)-like permease